MNRLAFGRLLPNRGCNDELAGHEVPVYVTELGNRFKIFVFDVSLLVEPERNWAAEKRGTDCLASIALREVDPKPGHAHIDETGVLSVASMALGVPRKKNIGQTSDFTRRPTYSMHFGGLGGEHPDDIGIGFDLDCHRFRLDTKSRCSQVVAHCHVPSRLVQRSPSVRVATP